MAKQASIQKSVRGNDGKEPTLSSLEITEEEKAALVRLVSNRLWNDASAKDLGIAVLRNVKGVERDDPEYLGRVVGFSLEQKGLARRIDGHDLQGRETVVFQFTQKGENCLFQKVARETKVSDLIENERKVLLFLTRSDKLFSAVAKDSRTAEWDKDEVRWDKRGGLKSPFIEKRDTQGRYNERSYESLWLDEKISLVIHMTQKESNEALLSLRSKGLAFLDCTGPFGGRLSVIHGELTPAGEFVSQKVFKDAIRRTKPFIHSLADSNE